MCECRRSRLPQPPKGDLRGRLDTCESRQCRQVCGCERRAPVPLLPPVETAFQTDRYRPRITGAEIRPLTVADLPSPDTKRWVIQRKAEVVAAVHAGLLSLEQACRRYSLDCEEFQSWERCIE